MSQSHRQPPPHMSTSNGGISRPRGGGAGGHSVPTGPVSAAASRQGFFRSQLTRRPTGPGTSSNNSSEKLRLDVDILTDSSEIVVRNQQGEIELGDPPTPIVEDDEQAEDRHETERERQRLAEAVKHHSINHSSVPEQPEELLEAVRASLRAKVTALADDNWMFEAEEHTRG